MRTDQSVNLFLPGPLERPDLSKRGNDFIKTIKKKYGASSWRLISDETLDIGPVRGDYYSVLAHRRDPAKWFPFGPFFHLLDVGRTREYGRNRTDANQWLENDGYLSQALHTLNIRWYDLELAMFEAFATVSPWGKVPRHPDVIGAHNATLVRVDMFHVDNDRKQVRACAKANSDFYVKAPSMFKSWKDEIEALQWKSMLEDFSVKSAIPEEFRNFNTLSRSPFVTPVVQALARAIHENMDVGQPHTALPIELVRILDAKKDFYPCSVNGQPSRMRSETWRLVAAICNHLKTTVFGIRLLQGDCLTEQAVKQRCGKNNREILTVLRP